MAGRIEDPPHLYATDAVSPVVGAILLVAVAVALSAVVTHTFLGFGASAEDNVRATIDLRYDKASQGIGVILMDRREADYVEVRYRVESEGGDELYAGLMGPGARVQARSGNSTLLAQGDVRVQDPDHRFVAEGEPVPSDHAADQADEAAGGAAALDATADGSGQGEPRFERRLEEDDVVRVTVIAHRADDSSVLVDRQYRLD